MYYEGAWGYPQDYSAAFQNFLLAAWSTGHPQSRLQLGTTLCPCFVNSSLEGHMFYKGEGVGRNLTTARMYYSSAAQKGNAEALYMMGT